MLCCTVFLFVCVLVNVYRTIAFATWDDQLNTQVGTRLVYAVFHLCAFFFAHVSRGECVTDTVKYFVWFAEPVPCRFIVRGSVTNCRMSPNGCSRTPAVNFALFVPLV